MPPAPRSATISYRPSRSPALRDILSGSGGDYMRGRGHRRWRNQANCAAMSSVYSGYAGPADFRLLRHTAGAAPHEGSRFCPVRRYRVDGIRHLAAARRDETCEVQRLAVRTAAVVRAAPWSLVRDQRCAADGRAIIHDALTFHVA